MKNNEELKKEILRLTAEYSRRLHKGFRPSDDTVSYTHLRAHETPEHRGCGLEH